VSDFFFFEFAIALVVVIINGFIAKLLAGIWLSNDKAKIAAFAFMLGSMSAAGGYDYGVAAGALVGLVALGWLLFKREKTAVRA
jgi:hypothetical protein